MASSQHRAITLHHQLHDTGYRLFELPPELESLFESEAAPILTLESSDSSTAVLKTADKSYALRQKNTSNALFLLAPQPTGESLVAVSTLHETVELDAVPETPISKGSLKDTGNRGKWHEKFARGR